MFVCSISNWWNWSYFGLGIKVQTSTRVAFLDSVCCKSQRSLATSLANLRSSDGIFPGQRSFPPRAITMNSAPSWSPGLSWTSSLAIFTVRPDLKSTSNVTLKPCLVVVMDGHPGLLDGLGLPWDEVYSMYAMMDLLKVIVPVIFITPRPLSFARVAHVVTSASIDMWQVTSLTCSHVLITHLTIISKKKINFLIKTSVCKMWSIWTILTSKQQLFNSRQTCCKSN